MIAQSLKHPFLQTGLGFLALFIIFTLVVSQGVMNQPDIYLTTKIQQHTSISLDLPLSFLSVLGSFEPMIVLLMVVILLGYRQTPWWRKIAVIGLFLLGHGLEIYSKTFFHHLGPPPQFLRLQIHFQLPSSMLGLQSSYLSGHSFRMMFLYVICCWLVLTRKRISVVAQTLLSSGLSILAFVTLFSRVSLGEHWTSDVIAGSLLGVSFGLWSLYIIDYKIPLVPRLLHREPLDKRSILKKS